MTNPFIDRRAILGASLGVSAAAALPYAVRAEDKPGVPTTPRPSVTTYAATPVVDHIALSPDGKRVAIISQKGDEKILLLGEVAAQGFDEIPLGPVKIRGLFWGSNQHVILTTSTTTKLERFAGDRHEFLLGRSIDLETLKIHTLFTDIPSHYGIVMGNLQRIKVNGEYRITASNRRIDSYASFSLFSFKSDGTDGKFLIFATPETQEFVVTPEGRAVAYSVFNGPYNLWELYYNVAPDGKEPEFKRIYKQRGEAINYPDLLGLGRDGKSVVIRIYTSKDEDQTGFREISAEGVLSEALVPENDGIPRFPLFHPNTQRLAGFGTQNDWPVLEWSDPLLKKLYGALPDVLGETSRCRIESYAEDARKMIVYTEGPDDAGSYFFCDFSTGEIVPIAVNYPDLPAEWITQKTVISYKAGDGLEISGYLTLPPFQKNKNLPLVVLPHGGPHARDYINFDWQTQVLAAQGYAVLQPNFRGSSGYGGAFATAGNEEFGRKMQTDLSDGVRHLVSKGIVDGKRVAIMGASYGGYAALAGATLDPGIYRCAVSIAGVSDPKSFVAYVDRQTGASRTSVLIWRQRMGQPGQYDDISPFKQAPKASCPILLIHGTDDTIVPIDQSQRMDKALKAAGKPVEFITYKGQDHWETNGSSRIAMMEAAISFLQKHNPA